jgi:hypothetical protein
MDLESASVPDDGEVDEADRSTESILEALLVDDAEVTWDPVTGQPLVSRRPKIELDRLPGSAYDPL